MYIGNDNAVIGKRIFHLLHGAPHGTVLFIREKFKDFESGEFKMRRLMAFLSFVFGALTFAVVAAAGREGSSMDAAYA